jgi:cryptochrome
MVYKKFFFKNSKEWNVQLITFEKDPEAIWRERDQKVKDMCARNKVQVIEKVSHTLYDSDEIFSLNRDAPPNTCDQLRKFCYKIGEPDRKVKFPELNLILKNLNTTDDLYEEAIHKVPDLDRFGLKPDCPEQEIVRFKGGEMTALRLYKRRIEYEIEALRKGKLNPNLSKPVLFTKEISLSPYLRFGCLSVRKFYWALRRAFEEVKDLFLIKNMSISAHLIIFLKNFTGPKDCYCPAEQLYWREYFYQLSYKNEKYAQVDGNPMCFKIPWDYFGKQDLFLLWEQVWASLFLKVRKISFLDCLRIFSIFILKG